MMDKLIFQKQLGNVECGIACFKMICDYYHLRHSYEYIKSITPVSPNGISLFEMTVLAEKLGLRATGVKLRVDQLIEQNKICILVWGKTHYVVMPPNDNSEGIVIANPASSIYKVNKDTLEEVWVNNDKDKKGYALVITLKLKGRLKERIFDLKDHIVFFSKYILPLKNKFIILLMLLVASGAVTFLNPIITKNLVDKGINFKDIRFVELMLLAQFLLFLGSTATDLIQTWLLTHINNAFSINLLKDFLLKLARLPISFFDKKNIGNIQQRIYDHNRIQYFITGNSVSIIAAIVNFLAFFFVLAYLNIPILIIVIISSVLSAVWTFFFFKKRSAIDYKRFYNLSDNYDNLNELIIGMQEVKLNNNEKYRINKWYDTQVELNKIDIEAMKVNQKQLTGSSFLNQLEGLIIAYVSAFRVIKGTMTIGTMMSINIVAGQLKSSITQFILMLQSYQNASISIKRLKEIHDHKDEEKEDALVDVAIEDLVLKDVSFKYDDTADMVLKNITMVIPKGKTTAIVGSSGSGKTTLLKLLLKYYPVTIGTVMINNENRLEDISSKWWWQKCGIVMQDGYIFSDSVLSNIAMSTGFDEAAIKEAIMLANIDELIETMPQKSETKVGPKGLGISGGQKQRLLIARAAYKKPEILFLDEATSSLDTENEKTIVENIEFLFPNTTKVIVAHRFSTIKNAHQIIVLDKGQIIETGTHEQLINMNGKYNKLFSEQFIQLQD